MNEFEWRRQMRDLRQPVSPPRDLWTSIEAALDDAAPVDTATETTSTPVRSSAYTRRWLVGAGLAASLLLVAGLSFHLRQMPGSTTAAIASKSALSSKWKPADPRLAGAAIELDAARMELQQAMQQAPDSPALQRILARTEHQQTQLRQLAREAG
ncbi:hypothetical protein [Rhodanobacter sp. L36]|uniref:hypothetical protein n=1 Tax=Rhodanobacter sp. L36 TaxID=1747221 RepID=UPI00131E3C7C|nr:hypothetical protein [Rhodanobacter sp. L36]